LVAYVLLAVLSLFALLANRSAKALPLAAVWIVLLGVSLYRTAAIPFFAIVACQVLATNWQSARERQASNPALSAGSSSALLRMAWLEPLVASIALWALVVLACPGWLQGTSQPRGWILRPDPSMQRLAEQLAEWHEQGQLDEHSRGFNLSTDMAHYMEWFCPQEKVFVDGRSNLFPPDIVSQFQQVGRALAPDSAAAVTSSDYDEALSLLGQWQCTHLLIADPVDRRIAFALRNLWQRPKEWSLAELQGRAALFAWQKPSSDSSPLPLPSFDLGRRALDPALAEKAPQEGITREPQPRVWWDCWEWPAADGELDRDEAAADLVHFEATRMAYFERDRATALVDLTAVPLATIGPHNAAVPSVAGLQPLDTMATGWQSIANKGTTPWDAFALQQITARRENSDQGAPGSLLLAVRAARRALHEDSDDALAHLRIGRAYHFLEQQTVERGLKNEFPLLEQLRKVQTLVALKRAVRLQPDLQPAHELLADVFLESRGYDLALPHVQQRHRLNKQSGPLPHESDEEFAARIDRLSDLEQQLGRQVRDLLNLADTQSFELGAYSKARLAESKGLPGYALEQLLSSNYAEFGREGAILELYLLLHAGRSEDFRQVFKPEYEPVLGPFNYHWMQTLMAAADGNYDQADEHLGQLLDLPSDSSAQPRPARRSTAVLDGLQVLTSNSNNPLQLLWQARGSDRFLKRQPANLSQETRQRADLHCLRGMLALESGDIEAARKGFREGLALWNGEGGAARLARHYLTLTSQQR
jgi:hypothetical protein